MEVFYDTDGNIIDLSKIVTVLHTLRLVADDGIHEWYVIRNHQYQFEDTSTRQVECEELIDDYGRLMPHYRIVYNDVSYYLPDVAGVIEYTLRKMWQQDQRTYWRKLSSQPKDYIKVYKECTGIDLIERSGRQHNGTDIDERYKGEDMFDNDYGTTEQDSEESGEYKDLNNL